MPAARHLFTTLQRHIMPPVHRPFTVDLGLAAGFFCAWLALSGFDPLVAAAMDKLRLAVSPGSYQLRWPPLGPSLIGLAALILAWIRHRFRRDGQKLQERLQRATLLAGALLALRLLTLFDPLVRIFPFLTILWSPHTLWALSLVYLGYLHLPALGARKPLPTTYIAATLFAVCLPMYGLYALYFCQVTMLHSDEGQYLRVTQSLVHDGDMDLANNLDIEQIKEFHVSNFALGKAPASPEGKIHSPHPIGLSVALVPAYRWGLDAWANPRLAAALFVALLASLCVPLIFIYLTRLGAEPWSALTATAITAVTGPYFYYSNQIYPEFPAIAIVLATLIALAHWQTPGGTYRSLGRWEIPVLGLLTLLLCCLPFLHPRLVPLGLFCGVLVLLQAWSNQRRWWTLSTIGLVVAGGLCALLTFHYAFSNDWLGPLRPGSGAWDSDALDIATWKISIPGQWLHAGRGILNNSPIFFFALFGLLTLAGLRDRRVVVALVLFAATAGINGLHTIWVFGHDLPGRFMMAATPVLAMGLAWGLPPLLRRAMTSFLVALAIAISLESVLHVLELPEAGYKGRYLLGRSINRYYPLHLHFFEPDRQDLPLLDIAFWGVLAGALFIRPRMVGLRAAIVAVAAFAPVVWSQSEVLNSRLQRNRAPYMPLLQDGIKQSSYSFHVPVDSVPEDAADSDGRIRARKGLSRAGLVGYSRMGALDCGQYRLTFHGLRVDAPENEISGYLSHLLRYTVPSVSIWSTHSNHPLVGGQDDGDYSFVFDVDRLRLGYVHTLYTGTGQLAIDGIRATFMPQYRPPKRKIAEIDRVSHQEKKLPIHVTHRFRALTKGNYRVRFSLTGSTFASFFERHPAPIMTAVYTLPPPARPSAYGAHPPWWLSIPFAGDEDRELRFVLDKTQDVHVLLQYKGKSDLDLHEIVLYRESYDHR